jgi:hypothetical protein
MDGDEMLGLILTTLRDAGWSADNIAFGSGGGLLQKLNRDTQKCAFKCSAITVKGEERVVFKDPITDPGKRSKKGRLTLHRLDDGGWCTKMGDECDPATDVLQDVFENGVLLVDQVRSLALVAARKPPNPPAHSPARCPAARAARSLARALVCPAAAANASSGRDAAAAASVARRTWDVAIAS